MSHQPERIEEKPAKDRKQFQTVIIMNSPAGFFSKAVAVVVALSLFALAFVFSLIFLAVLVAALLVFLAYAWWVNRRARKKV
ncbi:MAG: hypothetical protein COZ56_08925 [Armatimonadetes bacterium CG_4_8_14_3_um_filter_58_9]|nr:MAG: hypothetical protein COZ56_08925 [Armatimonadetes bacterium CG_4_8_14_3_um_filter_58_9]